MYEYLCLISNFSVEIMKTCAAHATRPLMQRADIPPTGTSRYNPIGWRILQLTNRIKRSQAKLLVYSKPNRLSSLPSDKHLPTFAVNGQQNFVSSSSSSSASFMRLLSGYFSGRLFVFVYENDFTAVTSSLDS